MNTNQKFNVAVIQASSVIMDRDASIEKAVSLIKKLEKKEQNRCFSRGFYSSLS